MSFLSRSRKVRLRAFEARVNYNSGPDRNIDSWQIVDIHHIPSKLNYQNEFDFWVSNDKDVYLLRLRKTKKTKYFAVKSKGLDSRIYLIVELDFENLDNELLKRVLNEFESRGIPKFKYMSMNLKLK